VLPAASVAAWGQTDLVIPHEPRVATDLRPDGGVVVGDDGSPEAEVAMRYAVGEARRWGRPLLVVRAWTIPDGVRPPDIPRTSIPSLEEVEKATLEETRRRTRRIAREAADVAVEAQVVHGPAAKALVTLLETADVLVIGSRGLGSVASVLLGSVAAQVIREATGPVVVVR
jgi:nucleotide-binding universal stress UspA family protein